MFINCNCGEIQRWLYLASHSTCVAERTQSVTEQEVKEAFDKLLAWQESLETATVLKDENKKSPVGGKSAI